MHVRLKNEFTEDEKYHNLMRWLTYAFVNASLTLPSFGDLTSFLKCDRRYFPTMLKSL